MSIKNKGDINFLKFIEFSKAIEDFKDNEKLVGKTIIHYFYNGNFKDEEKKIEEFTQALLTDCDRPLRYKPNLSLEPAGRFVDLENYSKDEELEELLKLLVKPKHIFQKVDVSTLSLQEGSWLLSAFMKGQAN